MGARKGLNLYNIVADYLLLPRAGQLILEPGLDCKARNFILLDIWRNNYRPVIGSIFSCAVKSIPCASAREFVEPLAK